jgi:hypothetical protein
MSIRNLIAAILTILVGALAVIDAFSYPRGTLLRMGPGYFPTVLGIFMIGFGAILLVQAFRPQPAAAEPFLLRPVLMIPIGVTLFALLVERCGLGSAIFALVIASSLSEPVFRPARAFAVAAGTSVLIYVVFILLLRLPFAFVTWSPSW